MYNPIEQEDKLIRKFIFIQSKVSVTRGKIVLVKYAYVPCT